EIQVLENERRKRELDDATRKLNQAEVRFASELNSTQASLSASRKALDEYRTTLGSLESSRREQRALRDEVARLAAELEKSRPLVEAERKRLVHELDGLRSRAGAVLRPARRHWLGWLGRLL